METAINSMNPRLCGSEIEYGCLIESDRLAQEYSPEAISLRVKDFMFRELGVGVLDEHYRDWGEPPGNGGFLFNGGRLYIDMGHVEYATPECQSVRDLIAYERAVDFLVLDALEGLGWRDEVTFVRNNVDHMTGATFGYHENYLVNRDVSFYKTVIPALLPFLVTRQIYAGSGRIGFHEEEYWEDEPRRGRRHTTRVTKDAPYQISQRSDHIVTEAYQWVQFSRAIINTRDEPLADSTRYRRVHLLLGDTNMSEYANMLKVGSTMVTLALIEEGCPIPTLPIVNPVIALRHISRDSSYRWLLPLETGRTISAIEIQGAYLALAERYLTGMSAEFDWVIREWRETLETLGEDPMQLKDRIDWVAKKWMLETFVEEEGLEWDDPWLQSLDIEYHKIDPDRSLYADLVEEGLMREVLNEREVEDAMFIAPLDTRAHGRSLIMRQLAELGILCVVDWDNIYLENGELIRMSDPFRTYENTNASLKEILSRRAEPPQPRRRMKDLEEDEA